MIFHEDIGIEIDGTQVQVVRQLGEEALVVVITVEDVRPAVAAAGDMIEGVGKIDAWWAGHARRLPSRKFLRNP
jgi:hypothetical protein